MAKTDALTADFLRQVLDYNPETGIFIRKFRPDKRRHINTQFAGKIAGTPHNDGYISIKIDGVNYLAHRLAFLYVHGYLPDNGEVDHINQNKKDNRIANLRDATHSQNQHNRTAYACNSTGLKGVSWHKGHKKWRSTIKVNGVCKHLGYYKTPEEAHEAYKKAAPFYHGDFARLSP